MEAIAAVNKLGWIGRDGKMMWHCPQDLQHFKEMTWGKKCLVGRVTYESLPPLSNRELLVVGQGHLTLEEALAQGPDIVIGGAQLYKSCMHLIKTFHLSVIDDLQVGDTRLPAIPFNVKIQVKRF